MRVLHVVRQFSPSVGGLEDFVLNLATRQRSCGIEAEVLSLDRIFSERGRRLSCKDEIEGIPITRIGYTGSRRYPLAPASLSCLRPYDLVHVHGVDFFCDYLSITQPLHRKPLVLTTHGGFFHTQKSMALKRLYFLTVTRSVLKRFAAVFASSEHDYELFQLILDERLRLIENGVDTRKLANCAAEQFAPAFVAIGRFAEHKGLERLLMLHEALCEHLPGARLELIGNDWDGTLQVVRRRLESMRHADSVRISTGLDDERLRNALGASCVFLSASRYEGFGLALVEAMSAGLIPIVNSIPSFRSILDQARVGLALDYTQDPAQLADKIAGFVRALSARYREARAAAIAASNRYDWKQVERRYAEAYEAVLGVRQRSILGVNIKVMRRSAAIAALDEARAHGGRLNLAFANANNLNIAVRDAEYRASLRRFLVLNDGLGVDIASRVKFGQAFAENLNGTDFLPSYLDATSQPLRLYLLGSTERVVRKATQRFRQLWPQHQVVGCRNGYFEHAHEIDRACFEMRTARADMVLVAMGSPRQEMWIARFGDATGAAVLCGVGAFFDFMSEDIPRAPLWVRRARCEWMYRLLQEPKRLWRRYLIGNPAFLARVLRDRHRIALP